MDNRKTIVFAPHDDGGGAFGVLLRLARALVVRADANGYELHIYFLNSSVAKDGQTRLNDLPRGLSPAHKAFFVPTDNLIWLPKDPDTAAVIGTEIPDILRKLVRPLWHCWPCEPNWIRPSLPVMTREDWIHNRTVPSKAKWKEIATTGWQDVNALTREWWQHVDLGISMGVPQLHRLARREGFPSVEVGDWFFSVGLRGCMQESFVPPDVIATTEPDLRMIEADELKAREVWLTLHQAPHEAYKAHLAGSAVRFREMTGLLWTGDPPPDPITGWNLANNLRSKIFNDISGIRGTSTSRVAYIVTGKTGVWKGVIGKLNARPIQTDPATAAVIDLRRGTGTITLLEDGGRELPTASSLLKEVPSELRHLATCRASDFGIARSAGGVLGCAETVRPSIFVDEPGHWLGRIQREQCHAAGLCVVVPIDEFRGNPADAIQKQAEKLGTKSDLDETVEAAKALYVGAERDLAQYLFETYVV
jgi:hypothetical protein